ncbi:MAG: YdcF family protein [Xanthomonadaceae bacterium]|nr:YdcF family protein [Xanthomonadaceae bacterium]
MWIASPLSWLVLAIVLGLPASRVGGRWRWLGRACAVLAALALLAMTPLTANALLTRLERIDPPRAACNDDAPGVVVVLAGGIDRLPRDGADFDALGIVSRRRLDTGMAYWRARPGRVLVITGGPAMPGLPAESALMGAHAGSLGVPTSAMRLETEATNTWQNAQRLAHMRPAIPQRIVLVTSALHMARARLAFDAAGFETCPLPSDYRFTPYGLPDALLPRSSALRKSEAVIHELIGLLYYRVRAWSDATAAR